MNQKNYTVNELLHNASFRKMANGTASADEIAYWSQWIEASEENRLKARKAHRQIAGFLFTPINKADKDQEWARLSKEIFETPGRRFRSSRKDSVTLWMLRIAASLLLVASVTFAVYTFTDTSESKTHLEQITQEETVVTHRDQQKTLTFTNGDKTAKITLNSNSSIKYNLGLIQDQPIEVTLEGEAFFEVEEGFSPNHSVFSVRTPDGIIKDIGTKFLVTIEDNRSRVILQEGLVNVKTDNEGDSKSFEVTKNQMVEFNKDNVIARRTVNSTLYTSWATGSMQFDRTSIRTFAQFVEQRFQVEVEIVEQNLEDITLDGAVYFTSLESLVRSVSEITKIPVYQSGNRDTLYIGNVSSTHFNPQLNK